MPTKIKRKVSKSRPYKVVRRRNPDDERTTIDEYTRVLSLSIRNRVLEGGLYNLSMQDLKKLNDLLVKADKILM